MKNRAIPSVLAGLVVLTALSLLVIPAFQAVLPQYLSPVPDAEYVSTGTAITVRYGPGLNEQLIDGLVFTVEGTESGTHAGSVVLADDKRTVIFKPSEPFTAGEKVSVQINRLRLGPRTQFSPVSYSFTVAEDQESGAVGDGSENLPENPPKSAFPEFLTVPQDIPHFTVETAAGATSDEYVFIAPFYWTKNTTGSYLLILNEKGQLVYYQSMADHLTGFDFKVQPNGMLSFFSQKDAAYYLMDSHYQIVDSYQTGNGYVTDLHDFQILPNGNALLMSYDAHTIDMSGIAKNGKKDAKVIGLIVQMLDPSKNVIFEWRSWDHFPFTDTNDGLSNKEVDLVHGNAFDISNDGNLLVSNRNQSEVTKINLQTGEVMWRLGGKANMFEFIGGEPFAFQHDIRQLENGNITIFDNQGDPDHPALSQGIEYEIDEENMTVTQVWSSTNEPPIFAMFMGNMQRLPNGNSFLCWGAPSREDEFEYVSATELTPDNEIVFELSFDKPYVSYRAFRFPWQGFPESPPDLAFESDDDELTLGYSWNGATEVAAYEVYGGSSPQALNLIEEKEKTDFEMQSHFTDLPEDQCYFQVAALDQIGNELARSNIISTDTQMCPEIP